MLPACWAESSRNRKLRVLLRAFPSPQCLSKRDRKPKAARESRGSRKQVAAMNKLLFADSAGPAWQKAYNQSHYALAALVPATLVSPQDGAIAKVADVGLAAAITVHNHVALNYVISDYVPRGIQVPVRAGVVGLTVLTALGLTKLALAGPGIGGAVKELWKKKE